MRQKIAAVATLILTAAFFFFFQYTKHDPILRAINVFNVDPYDAVGSFGVLLAGFISLVIVLRVVFSHTKKFFRLEKIVILSVWATLAADVIALVRFTAGWSNQHGALTLVTSLLAMVLLTTVVSKLIASQKEKAIKQYSFASPTIITFISILILAVYPRQFDQGLVGGIITPIIGMILFFFTVWSWMGSPKPLYTHLGWIVSVGLCLGLALAIAEAMGEGGGIQSLSHFAIVGSVFMGIGGAGVLVGYMLLGNVLNSS